MRGGEVLYCTYFHDVKLRAGPGHTHFLCEHGKGAANVYVPQLSIIFQTSQVMAYFSNSFWLKKKLSSLQHERFLSLADNGGENIDPVL